MDSLEAALEMSQMIKKCECSQTRKVLASSLEELLRIAFNNYHKLESHLQAVEEKNLKLIKKEEGNQITLDMSEGMAGDGV